MDPCAYELRPRFLQANRRAAGSRAHSRSGALGFNDGGTVNDDVYLNEKELSALLKVSPRTVQRWRENGQGPPFSRIGTRSIRYSLKSCRTWAENRTFEHRAHELTASKS